MHSIASIWKFLAAAAFLLLLATGTGQAAGNSPALEPEQALAYMKETENLVIVDVATRQGFARQHFEGAVNIPIENISAAEAKEMYLDLPAGRPVLLHCRLGMIVGRAYRDLKALRPDIPEISYIDGKPLFDEYNAWHRAKR